MKIESLFPLMEDDQKALDDVKVKLVERLNVEISLLSELLDKLYTINKSNHDVVVQSVRRYINNLTAILLQLNKVKEPDSVSESDSFQRPSIVTGKQIGRAHV